LQNCSLGVKQQLLTHGYTCDQNNEVKKKSNIMYNANWDDDIKFIF